MSNETWPDVMVTAHRRLPKGCVDEWLGAELRRVMTLLRDDFGMQRATTGMATGGDQAWGAVAMEIGMPLRAAIPYPAQPLDGTDIEGGGKHFGQKWTKGQQQFWARLKEYAEATGGVEHVFDRNPRSFQERVTMLHQRNSWMLEHNDAVVGVWAPANRRSGTGSCLNKAVGAGIPTILINLTTKSTSRPLPKHWALYLGIPTLAEALHSTAN
jgi:hypothetical protein